MMENVQWVFGLCPCCGTHFNGGWRTGDIKVSLAVGSCQNWEGEEGEGGEGEEEEGGEGEEGEGVAARRDNGQTDIPSWILEWVSLYVRRSAFSSFREAMVPWGHCGRSLTQ